MTPEEVEKEMQQMVEWGFVEKGKNEHGEVGWRITKKGIEEAEKLGLDK